jgi:hypothetical protein
MTDTPDLALFSPAFAEHLQKPPPDFLHHYTSQDGLIGIIDSSSLWASNVSYLNDATEFDLSLRLIQDSLSQAIQTSEWEVNHFATINPERATSAKKRKDEAGRLWRIAKRIDWSDICVICFCEDGDLLSQWRGYAVGSYGYSIAFIPSKLKEMASESGFILGQCIYDTNLQKEIIVEGLEYLLTKGEPGERADIKEFAAIIRYGAFFKDPSFKEEREWRLVSTRVKKTCFRKGKSMIIPYTSLPISSAKDFGIDHAIIGPCPHEKLSKLSVESILSERNIDAFVESSAIPFRDWSRPADNATRPSAADPLRAVEGICPIRLITNRISWKNSNKATPPSIRHTND